MQVRKRKIDKRQPGSRRYRFLAEFLIWEKKSKEDWRTFMQNSMREMS